MRTHSVKMFLPDNLESVSYQLPSIQHPELPTSKVAGHSWL